MPGAAGAAGADAALPPARLAWLTLAALFAAYILSFVDRMIIGLLVDGIKRDLNITDTQVSLLQGLAFALFFTVAAIPIGRLVDRVHRARAVAGGIALWSVMTMACGWAASFPALFAARMGVGVGEAVLSPAAYSVINDSFPRRRLGLAMGIFGLGSAVGAGLAFMIGGAVVALVANADTLSLPLVGALRPWQFAFVVAGLPGLAIALLFLVIPDPRHRAGAVPGAVPLRTVARHLRVNARFFVAIFGAVAAVNVAVLGSVSWLPALLIRGFALPVDRAGYLSGGLLIVGGLIGMVGGGIAMDRIGGGSPSARLRFAGTATALATVAAVAFPLVGSLWVLGFAFVAFFAAAASVVGAAPAVLQMLAPDGMRATIAAVYVFVINGIGIGFGPSVTAVLGDRLFPGGDGIRYAMAIVAPTGYAIGAILFFIAARRASSPSR